MADATDAANIDWVEVLVNGSFGGVNACYLHYDRATNVIYLRDDSNPSWVGSASLGIGGTLTNSQCVLDAGASSASAAGANLTLNLSLTFKQAFAGTQNVYTIVNSGALNSGWQTEGTWTVPLPSGALPSGWSSSAIGNSYSGNSATYNNGVYTLVGPGDGMGIGWFSSWYDSLQFDWAPLVGDGTIVARWTGSQQIAGGGSRWGVMIREGITPTTTAHMGVNGNYRLEYLWRPTTGVNMGSAGGTQAVTAPYWLKLVRAGNVFTGYASPDGVAWTQVGVATVTMGATAYAGLVVTSADPNRNTTATFDHVVITNSSGGTSLPDFSLSATSASNHTVNAGGTVSFALKTTSIAAIASRSALR